VGRLFSTAPALFMAEAIENRRGLNALIRELRRAAEQVA
jgi:hypothetical protein